MKVQSSRWPSLLKASDINFKELGYNSKLKGRVYNRWTSLLTPTVNSLRVCVDMPKITLRFEAFIFSGHNFLPGIDVWHYAWQYAGKFIQASVSTVFTGASLHRHDVLLFTWLNFRSTDNMWHNVPTLNHVVVFSDMTSLTLRLSGIDNTSPKSYCYYIP